MPFTVSRPVLDAVLRQHRIAPNDLTGIDKLFGGVDGYYWYHTLRHMCLDAGELSWDTEEQMRSAVQGHEDATAAEDEVKPQQLKDSHLAAMAALLRTA